MARNIYFSEKVRSEQSLYEDIVVEALKIYGFDMYYLPRDIVKKDDLLNEDVSSRFNSSYMIEMYVDNVEGFDGQGDLFSKFGVEIRDTVTLTVARRRWAQAVKRYDNELTGDRPLEGDLIYIPFSRKLFQITKVEHEAPFYQLTNLPTYKLQCELFEFSGDDFDTGVTVIDEIERSYAYKYILGFATDNAASATITIAEDTHRLKYVTLTNPGSGYTSAPLIEISRPTATPTRAQARAYSDGNTITSIEILDSGELYLLPPTISQLTATPGDRFYLGNNSLRHDSAAASYVIPTLDVFKNDYQNRLVYRMFLSLESSGNPTDMIMSSPFYALYHRASDHKLVFQDSSRTIVSPGTLQIYDPITDSGDWNYVEMHFLTGEVKLFVNSVEMEEAAPRAPTNINDPVILTTPWRLGAPDSATLSYIDSSLTTGFIGNIDHWTLIPTLDDEFRFADPRPINVSQMELDGDTLKRAEIVYSFDYANPLLGAPSLLAGRVTTIPIIDGGVNMTDSFYDLTISAPDGSVRDSAFQIMLSAILGPDGSIIDIQVENAGGGYVTTPSVKIYPQGGDVLFEPGDKVYQTLSSGVVIEGEVAQFSDSDYKVHVINVQTSDGEYHDFSIGARLNLDSANGPGAFVTSIVEVNQLSEIEQNDTFSTEAAGFLDFTETNPFGDPENN